MNVRQVTAAAVAVLAGMALTFAVGRHIETAPQAIDRAVCASMYADLVAAQDMQEHNSRLIEGARIGCFHNE